jgi:hypothetical protein
LTSCYLYIAITFPLEFGPDIINILAEGLRKPYKSLEVYKKTCDV